MANRKGNLDQLCKDAGVRLIPSHKIPGKMETRARATIRAIYDAYGRDGAAQVRFTLLCIGDTGNIPNKSEFSAEVIGAVSDVLFAQVPVKDFSTEILNIFSQIDLGSIRRNIPKNENKRDLIAGAINEKFIEIKERQNEGL